MDSVALDGESFGFCMGGSGVDLGDSRLDSAAKTAA